MKQKLNKIKEMLSPNYNWEAHWNGIENETIENTSINELIRKCYLWHDYRKGNRPKAIYDCGSMKFSDTPKVLYRMLYLIQPSQIDFSHMYKTGTLVDIVSPCYNYLASFQLWKYEASLYFGCPHEDLAGRSYIVICNIPGSDNGLYCKNPLGLLWFEVIQMALNFEYDVYSGNNFKV